VCIEGRGPAGQNLDSDTEPTHVALAYPIKTTYGKAHNCRRSSPFQEILDLSSMSYVFCTENTDEIEWLCTYSTVYVVQCTMYMHVKHN
jgi:hypothetical protein